MKRFAVGWVVVTTVALSSIHLSAQTENATETENNRATFGALEKSISIDFSETSLTEALEFLQEETGLRYWIHESARENGMDEGTEFNVHLSNTRLATILDLMLEEHQCTYSVQDGIVKILSDDAALDQLNVHVLDCRKLLKQIGPKMVKRHLGRSGGFGGSGRGGGAFSIQAGAVQEQVKHNEVQQGTAKKSDDVKPKADKKDPEQPSDPYLEEVPASEQLIRVIFETIDPDSWEENGGTGRLQEINGMLVVVQTSRNLRRIKILLENLDVVED